MRRIASVMLVALAATCSVPSRADADGCYIPERAHPTPPSIPRQRALIVHRDGVERLIVESSLDAEGQTFGWIIPVPAPPHDLAKVTPGVLDTLEFTTEGRLTHDLHDELWFAVVVAGVSFLVFGSIVRWWKPAHVLLILVYGLLFCSFVLPSMGRAGHRGVVLSDPLRDGVNASRFTQIGSYDVAVLEATRADALDGWLEKNGFASLPPAGRSIAEQYIREKWSFVVARLRRDGTGLCSPHPLSMSFSANKAVYPMRLTSLSSSPVALDLYCLADYEASAQGLQRKFCDAFTGPKPYTLEFPFSPTQDRYRAKSSGYEIGLPSLVEVLWDGCVLTRLSAAVTPGEMGSDYRIDSTKPSAYESHRYSHKGAMMTGVCWSLFGWSGLLILRAIATRRKHGVEKARRIAVKGMLRPVSLVGVLSVGVIYLVLPKVAVTVESRAYRRSIDAIDVLMAASPNWIEDERNLNRMSIGQMRERCRSLLRDKPQVINPYSGAPIREQESPGDYQIIEDQRGIVFRLYGRLGWPQDRTLQRPRYGKTSTATSPS